jgi:hypothetical protein
VLLVLVEQVVHRPELALSCGCLGGFGSVFGMRV